MHQRLGLRAECMEKQSARTLSHDNLFHSMLGLLDVQTALHQPALDVFAGCR